MIKCPIPFRISRPIARGKFFIMYGLDSFVSTPPISAITSLLLIIACDGIGVFAIKVSGLNKLNAAWLRWQAPIVGTLLLSVFSYPLALAGFATLFVFRIVGTGLIVISLIHLYKLGANLTDRFKQSFFLSLDKAWHGSLLGKILVLLLLSYGLFALSPLTQADSLNYHVGVALHILNTGSMPVTPEWFHSRLAGNGEVLNAIGLALGAEQFCSLLQFTGLVGLAGLFYQVHTRDNHSQQKSTEQKDFRIFLTTAALSAPVLVFLVGGAKFQLLPIAMTTLALSITVYQYKNHQSKSLQLKCFAIVCLLVMVASQAKMNYLLGGGVVGTLSLILMYKNRLFGYALIIGVLSAIIILLPPVTWKSINFGGSYADAFLTPFPGGWPGTDRFEEGLRNYRDSPIWFPFSLLIPNGIGTITTVIGVGSLGFLFLKPSRDPKLWAILLASCIVFVLTAILGPPTSRSYLEPFFWLLFVLTLQRPHSFFIRYRTIIQTPILLQSIMVIIILWYGIITAVPGALSSSSRVQTMTTLANGYELMQWVDKVLPKNAILLSSHRSMGLAPRDAVSLDWVTHTEKSKKALSKYLNRLKERKVTYLLIHGNHRTESTLYKLFVDCFGTEKFGPGFGHRATRNPFNIGEPYEAWLYSLEYRLLPNCVNF